jgi:hypothetical protein
MMNNHVLGHGPIQKELIPFRYSTLLCLFDICRMYSSYPFVCNVYTCLFNCYTLLL